MSLLRESSNNISNKRRGQSNSMAQEDPTATKLHSVKKEFQRLHAQISANKENNQHPKTQPLIAKELDVILTEMNTMTAQWNCRLAELVHRIETLQKSLEKVNFKQRNFEAFRNISQMKSNTMLLQKINRLEEKELEGRNQVKKLLSEISQKNGCLQRITLSFQQLRSQLREMQEQLTRWRSTKGTIYSQNQIEDIQNLVRRFNNVRPRHST